MVSNINHVSTIWSWIPHIVTYYTILTKKKAYVYIISSHLSWAENLSVQEFHIPR